MEVQTLNDELVGGEYDEEADSDFGDDSSDQVSHSSGEDDEISLKDAKKGKITSVVSKVAEELDSGDEATIKERQKAKKRQKRRTDGGFVSDGEDKDEGWRAKTRSMRAQEKAEKQTRTLATTKTSTVDVNRIWEEMNKPSPLPPVQMEGQSDVQATPQKQSLKSQDGLQAAAPIPFAAEETITIKRQFKFAGEVHIEEKVVSKSSAEAKLWLAQQEHKSSASESMVDGMQRPLRKISRFDPNYSNLDAFRNDTIKAQPGTFKGAKLNVVEKSKMDWASHVDAEGLKDELDVHAKAKDAYLNRMDFLSQVERRKEDEARSARMKG
ncbi:swr complex subunit [Neophaeococcomyces mojaviensis]|uniref:Swr complex subunit n=1 Tax=Neophaeococcomyces mojaviensis TaxID=3383035 RepID=A0ACC3AL02_9EURO|nr:swr complex subunit [Knufia sp. JES_112]